MTAVLRREGYAVNRKRVRRLMRLMGLQSLAPGPDTSRAHPAHPVYPYLAHGISWCSGGNQVWATDITYIRIERGFAYLVAVMDWHSRKVLAWRLSNTLDTEFCVEALQEALRNFGTAEIFNTDKVASLRVASLPACCRPMGYASAWMARVGHSTISSWSDCGAPSSMRRCILSTTRP